MMKGRVPLVGAAAIAAVLVCAPAAVASTTLTLLPGTAVLLSKGGSGPLSSASSSTDSFSPAAYADYKHFGGEPTVVIDRYPVTSGRAGLA